MLLIPILCRLKIFYDIKISKRENATKVKELILDTYKEGYNDYTSGILKFKNIRKYVLKKTSFYKHRNDYKLLIDQVESDFFNWVFKNPDKDIQYESLKRYVLDDSNIIYDEGISDPLLEKYLNMDFISNNHKSLLKELLGREINDIKEITDKENRKLDNIMWREYTRDLNTNMKDLKEKYLYDKRYGGNE